MTRTSFNHDWTVGVPVGAYAAVLIEVTVRAGGCDDITTAIDAHAVT